MNNINTNRKTVRIEGDDYLVRIFKDLEGKVINVYRHERDIEIEQIMQNGKKQYETAGTLIGKYPTKEGWTLKEIQDTYAKRYAN